ncbi:GNAT family N-acetyltransferase [Massilia aerilata]|uniref:GNAT family N-acetyltransferase n=1 Tax=Massilia aerilata TaxID=453817 RepID=A0ABW0S5K7_9BURK
MNLTIRQLTPTDAAAYRALRLAALRAFPLAFQSDYEDALRQPLSWAEKRLATAGDTMFGAFDGAQCDARLVGAICLRMPDGRKVRHAAELKALAVDPERQRQGIGRALVAHLLAHARALGHVRQISLTVIDGNTKAQQLYAAFGFQPFGLEPEALLLDGRYHAKQHRQLIL